MAPRPVTVLGAGVTGLCTALVLARDGHRVTLLERDAVEAGGPEEAPGWSRRGIPHFLQPHAVLPRGRRELRTHLPDVYASLLAAGACDVDVRRKLPGPPRAGDEDLQYLAARRPLLEWALRRAVAREPGVVVRDRVHVTGLLVDDGRVTGVQVDGTDRPCDLVVDALGRRSPTPQWLAATGAGGEPPATSDCGMVAYSRYYRQRPGFDLPDGPWLVTPRGDLGYLAFTTFPGDNRTFAAAVAVPSGRPEWRALRQPGAFEAALASIPVLRAWVDPDGVEPITGVLPIGGLRNTLRSWWDGGVPGLVPVGDAASHTDPALAHGLSFAVVHALELARALREQRDVRDAGEAFAAATEPVLRERYEFATELDEQRYRMWTGGHVDPASADGDYALFSLAAAGAVASVDADVARVFLRRMGLLDSTAVLDEDRQLQRRIEQRFGQLLAAPRPPAGPGREEMLEVLGRAAAETDAGLAAPPPRTSPEAEPVRDAGR